MPDIWLDVDVSLAEVPINKLPLLDSTDFVTIEASVVYNATGLTLVWNFVTPAGAFAQTAVTPTDTAGDYDWVNQGNGFYTIEIPASSGATINNDTEGYGWFSGVATGVLPWIGPVIGFRASGLNDLLIESAYSATRGLTGTALPNAAADAAGGVIVSDAGGLDADATIGALTYTVANKVDANVTHISGDSTAADNQEAALETIVTGAAEAGTLSVTQMTTDLSEATDDHYGGLTLGFRTGNLAGQKTRITAYVGATGLLTFDELTEAPTAGDTFVIL